MSHLDAVEKLPHHDQLEFCYTRAKYRQGRKLTSVKVYTVNDESRYLIITGVPAIKIVEELERLCLRYGDIEVFKALPDYPQKEFEEAYLVKYKSIKKARFAKVKLDGKSFYGGVLHVCYAPELETLEDTREKLSDRRKSIAALTRYKLNASEINKTKQMDNVQIRRAATKRYLSKLKEDVSCIYQKYFETDKASKVAAPQSANVTEMPSELSDETVSCNVLGNMNSMHNNDKFTSCENSKEISIVPSNEMGTNSHIPQATAKPSVSSMDPPRRKKIKIFKNTKILSYSSKEKI
ncbi:RNA-binding protein 48-like isoform X1 [Palaemon carinicauda]|uniref:RNA-binding protein 48-like isoform X1 n=1 Tax=Palaemon carinicauda TaxID=392227 RepID=UPI0035B5ED95